MALGKAFSDEDPIGHRRYHDLLIAAEIEKSRLRKSIIEKSLTGLVWIALAWVGLAIWNAFKHSLGIPG